MTKEKNKIWVTRLFGIDIFVDYSWFWILSLIFVSFSFSLLPSLSPGKNIWEYIIFGMVGSFLFFGSILSHELVHILVGRRSGIISNRITLFIFGGVSELSSEPANPRAEYLMAISGPLSSLVLALLLFGISKLGGDIIFFKLINSLGMANLFLGIFNLFPGFPLDGGRVLRAVIWGRTNNLLLATKIASNFGKGLAIFLAMIAVLQIFFLNFVSGVWLILISFFLYNLAHGSYFQALISFKLSQKTIKQVVYRNAEIMTTAAEIKGMNISGLPSVDQDRPAIELFDIFAHSKENVVVMTSKNVPKAIISKEDLDHLIKDTLKN